jgi:hypothetical protein
MQRQSILIGTPHYGDLLPEYVLSLLGAIEELRKTYNTKLMFFRSPLVSNGRNAIAETFLTKKFDYLMFIDSDIIFPPYAIGQLIKQDKDVIGGMYFEKGESHRPVVYELNKRDRFEALTKFPKEPFKCDGIGAGFLLVKFKVLDSFSEEVCARLGKPFNMRQRAEGGEEGEDLAACRRFKELGFEIWCDPTFKLGHVGLEIFDERHYKANLALGKFDKFEYTNDIDGWMSNGELNWLYQQAKKMKSIAEIGSWKGRSTHALLSGCKGTVYAIDHFQGSKGEEDEHREAKEKDIYEEFLKNVGDFKNLQVLKMTGDEASKHIDKVDMVFLDGEHSYKAVKNDINKWLPKAKKLICGHDYNWQGVRMAVDEVLGDTKVAETIWYKESC